MLFPKLFLVDSVCAQLNILIFFTENLNSASNCFEEHFKPKQFLPRLFVFFFSSVCRDFWKQRKNQFTLNNGTKRQNNVNECFTRERTRGKDRQ